LGIGSCTTKKQQDDPPLLFVPEDLEVSVWAESPMFFNPTNMDVDAKGRVWITEGVNYRDFRNADGHKVQAEGDRIMILEDTDNDGKADSSKVFVQDSLLRSPLGIAVLGNQVIVSCSPNVIVYTDEDGDDLPDSKEVFLTGFGGRDHDHGLHAGQLGPDGKWYFITGNAGPHKVSGKDGWTLRSGSVYNEYTPFSTENIPSQISDDGEIYTGGLVIRINPDGTGMEVVSHNFRNAFEVAVDSFGNMWQSDNDDQTASCRTTWLMEGSNAGFFSERGDRTWQADRRPGQTIAEAHWHQHDPGVLPVGDIYGAGSPTGMVRIEGDELGEQFRGLLLSADAGRNIIFGYQPEVKGAGYSLRNRSEFVASVDKDNPGYIWHQVEEDPRKWFRPSDVTIGIDGSLFIADWYDPIVGGHQMRDKIGEGKIYRIAPKGKTLTQPKIDYSTTEGQLAAMLNPAVHVRAYAMEQLKKQGPVILPELKKLMESDNHFYRARAIWAMAGLGDQGIDTIVTFLKDADQEIVLTTIRALAAFAPERLLEEGLEIAREASPLARRELALMLEEEEWEKTSGIYEEIIKGYNGKDPWYRNALGIGMKANAGKYYAEELAETDPAAWTSQMASLVWEWHPKEAVPALQARLENESLDMEVRDRALETLVFIPENNAVKAVKELVRMESPLAEKAKWWLQFRKYNDWSAYLEDWDAPDVLPDARPDLLALKAQMQDSLATAGQIQAAFSQLAEDPTGRLHLALMAVTGSYNADSSFKKSQVLEPEERPAISKLLNHYFAEEKGMDEKQVLNLQADPVAGKVKTTRNCLACHRIAGTGNEIGPDLSQIGEKMDFPTLVNAIVLPDGAVGFGSEAYLIALKNGAVLYGLLQSAGPVVTVLDFQGKRHVLPAEQVMSRKQLSISLMPGPSEMNMNAQDVADISAFLMQSNTSD
jgi:putative membrane-bound dehydrogenase-like protein